MTGKFLVVALWIGGLTLSGWTSAVRAQDTPKDSPGQETPQAARGGADFFARFRSAVEQLKLSDDQKQKVDKLLDQAEKDLKQAQLDAHDSRDQARRKSREIFDTLREDLASVLDKDQQAALREKIQDALNRDIIARIRSALEKLDLKDEQKQKVSEILAEAQDKAAQLRKTAQSQGQEIGDKFRQLMQDTRDKLENVLSEEQKQKLEDLFRQRRQVPRDQQDR